MNATSNQIFGRHIDATHVAILHTDTGEPVTRLDADVHPTGSNLGARYEHPEGIVLSAGDCRHLGIEIEDGNLTREQAVSIVGDAVIDRLDATNCEPTGRVGYNGGCQRDALTQWRSSVTAEVDGLAVYVSAYYYTTAEEDQRLANADEIDWHVDHYEVR